MYSSEDQALIYIAGYGRSGSTILERLLSVYTGSFSMGELSRFFDEIENPYKICGCGERVIDCSFWQNVYADFRRRIKWPLSECQRLQRRIENFSGLLRASGEDCRRYEKLMGSLFEAIKAQPEVAGMPLIDSSKTAYLCANRPLSLTRFCEIHCKVIHLVRDLRAVSWSLGRGRNRSLERGSRNDIRFFRFRAWLGWITANQYAARTKRILGKEGFILIRYEDLVSAPVDTLSKIALQFNLHMNRSVPFDDLALRKKNHQISGNRTRLSTLSIRPDYEWQSRMPNMDKRFIYVSAWPLMSAYGYEI